VLSVLKVFIDVKAIEECKQTIQEYYDNKDFKEVGGYMLGIFNGEEFHVKSFYLDKHAQSTAVRIKLSVDAFHEMEEILANSENWLYIGTWHVHPGMNKPFYSSVDVSTLFLERIILDTDNPENLEAPKIHIIFNSALSEHSCYIMDLKFDYYCEPLDPSVVESIVDSELLDVGIDILKESKTLLKGGELENYYKLQKNIEDTYENLDSLSDQIRLALDILNEFAWYEKQEGRIHKVIKNAIKNGERLGVIYSENKKKIDNLKYRPKYIKKTFEEGSLVGFWVLFPYENVDELFLKIFLANFYNKVESEPGDIFLFFLVQKIKNDIDIEPFFLNFNSIAETKYIELETELIEEDSQ